MTSDTTDPTGRRVARTRRDVTPALWPVLLAWTALWAWLRWSPSGISWHFFPEGARLLLGSSGLHLYAQHPELQIGPLAFLAVAPLMALPAPAALVVGQLLMTAAGPAALWLVAPLAGPPSPRRALRVGLAGLVLMPAWTVLSVRWGHPDDVLAMLAATAAVRFTVRDNGFGAGLMLGLAVAAKPWAVGFAPLLLALPRREVLRGAVAAAGAALAAWLPFVAADSGTLAALRPPVLIADTSPLRLVGIGTDVTVTGAGADVVPAWTRTVQLLAAPAVAALAVLRGRWPGLLLAAVAVRLLLDPQDNGYYEGTAVLAAVVADLGLFGWTLPWAGALTYLALWHPFVPDFAHRFQTAHGPALWWFQHPSGVAAIHTTWAVVAVAVVLLPVSTRSSRPATPGRTRTGR